MRRWNEQRAARAGGFTLVELLGALVIVGAVAGVCAPVMLAASEGFTRASDQREALERASFAMERVVRLLRDAPQGAGGGGAPGIASASVTGVELDDGGAVELLGTTLWLTPPGGQAAPLCQNVSAFELTYLGSDGVTDTRSSPSATRRIGVRIAVGGAELRSAAFLRATMGAP